MFGLSLADMIPKSFTLKNGLVLLCHHIEEHENVHHEVRHFELRVNPSKKTFDVMIWHPGTKKPTYSDDVLDNGLFFPIKYELEGHKHLYNYDQGAFIVNMIEKLVKKETKTEHTIDYIAVEYDDSLSEIPYCLYLTTDKGEKLKIKQVIK